jgi:hypothetical protein
MLVNKGRSSWIGMGYFFAVLCITKKYLIPIQEEVKIGLQFS